jgi:hypothetical protein
MDLFEKRADPIKTVKTKSGKDISEEKYKTMLASLELARQAKRSKKAGDVPATPSTSPAQAPSPAPVQPAKPELSQLDKALMLISLQDKKIKELTAKPAIVEQPKPVETPKPTEPIDIPKPFVRHWSLLE